MKRRTVIVIAVALLGAALGYLGGFVQFKNESTHGSEYSSWEYEWLIIPAYPGILISSAFRTFDYQLTEQWIQDKHNTAIWNGVLFAVLALTPALLIKRSQKKSNTKNHTIGKMKMKIKTQSLISLLISVSVVCWAEEKSVSSETNDNLRIATRIVGSNCTIKTISQRKALFVTFRRLNCWGELKFLLLEMPEPFTLRVVPMQDSGGHGVGRFKCPKEELDQLFQEKSWEQLRKYGTLCCLDVFDPSPASSIDFPATLVGIVAKYALKDNAGLGREREWKTVDYRLKPMIIHHYEFDTNNKISRGGTVTSCSVFLSDLGIPFYSMADDITYLD